ncbi:MAG: hypothetical protein JWM93_3419, partial [Frankiales bacterium]|nr:hypothetical protein [Frankiales bacterium]
MSKRRRLLLVGSLLALAVAVPFLALRSTGPETPHSVPSFIQHALGAPKSHAPATLRPKPGSSVRLHDAGGFTLREQSSYLTLTSAEGNGGTWKRHATGAQRSTSFGNEEVVAGKTGAEQFLTVGRHVGKHTWSWLMDTNLGDPSVRDSGVVAFVHNHLVAQHLVIAAPEIFDGAGKKITPKGLRWSTAIRGDGKSYLQLTLDDTNLPVPYVIDPAIAFAVGMSGATASSGVKTFNVAVSATVNTGDLLVASVDLTGASLIPTVKGDGVGTVAFTQLASAPVAPKLFMFAKIATAADKTGVSTNFVVSWPTTNAGGTGIVGDYTNVPAGYLESIKTATTLTAPAVVPNQDGELVVAAYAGSTGTVWGGALGSWSEDVAGGKKSAGVTIANVEQLHLIAASATNGTTITPPVESGPTAVGSITATFRNTDATVPTTSTFAVATNNTITFTLTDANAGPAPVVPLPAAFTAHLTPDPPGSAVQNLTPTSVAIGAATTTNRTVTLTFAGTPFKTAGAVTLDYSNANTTAVTSAAFTTASGTTLSFTTPQAARFPASGKVLVGGYNDGVNNFAVSGSVAQPVSYPLTVTANNATTSLTVSGNPVGNATTTNSGDTVTAALVDNNGNLAASFTGTSVTSLTPAADGNGYLTVTPANVSASSTSNTMSITFHSPSGGITNGEVDFIIPATWSAPTVAAGAGHVTVSTGTIGTIVGQTVPVTGLTLTAGQTAVLTYTATIPAATGSATFTANEKSTVGGVLTALPAANQATVTINSADGAGSGTVAPSTSTAGTTNNTIVGTYTATTGGLGPNGTVTMTIPSNWTTPQTGTPASAGYVQANINGAGYLTTNVSIAARTITVTLPAGLASGQTVLIRYGDTSGGSTGAAAPAAGLAVTGTFTIQSKSTSAGGVLTTVAGTQTVAVTNSADGAGTATTSPASVSAGTSNNTIVGTYTATTGGINANGAVTMTIPTNWTTPQTGTASSAGYVRANIAGGGYSTTNVSIAARTITVTLPAGLDSGATVLIAYGDTSGGSTGAAAPAAGQAVTGTFTMQAKSTTGGTLTTVTGAQTVAVNNSADGAGSGTISPATSTAGSSNNTIIGTYTATAGGINV